MNDLPKNPWKLRIAAVAACLLTLSCSGGGGGSAADQPPLAGSSIGGDFALTGELGRTLTRHDFEGRYLLVYFGYTFCPDVCPADMQKIGAGLRLLEQRDAELAQNVVPLFVSVDPARDTPEILREFTDNFHPRMIGATGTREQIDAMTRSYGAYYAIGEDDGSGNYLVDHSANVTMFGPEGQPLAIIPTDGGPEAVAGEIERWAK